MSIEGFLNVQDYTAYPLMGTDESYSSSSSSAPAVRIRRGISDAGFVLGPKSGFDPLLYGVYLEQIQTVVDDVWFVFRCDAPNLLAKHWLFHFPPGTDFGCTAYADMSDISGGGEDRSYGTAWMTAGDLVEIRALGSGTYVPLSAEFVENARIQDASQSFVRTINLANVGRVCPDPCCSSSSSMSLDEAIIQATDIVGVVLMKEGVNCTLRFSSADNSLEIGAEKDAGAGPACQDILVDQSGAQSSLAAFCPDTASCDGYLRSVNGNCVSAGGLTIVGGPGMVITPNQSLHRVTVDNETNRLCASSSSFSP